RVLRQPIESALFARTLVATQTSMLMALASVGLGAVLGVLLGAVPALFGVRSQRFFSGLLHTWLAFPMLLIAMFLLVLLGNSPLTSILAMGLAMTPVFARLTQTLTLRISGADYIAAARMLGASRSRLLSRYVLPNVAEPLIVNLTLSFGASLLALSSLSFIGVGVIAPAYDWGRLLNEGFKQVYTQPAQVLGPALAVVIAGLSVTMLGESIAAALRERQRPPAGAAARARAAVVPTRAEPPEDGDSLLVVDGLSVSVTHPSGAAHTPVRDVSLSLRRGEIVGIVGESGSGKTLTVMAIAGLLPQGARMEARSIRLDGSEISSRADDAQPPRGIGVVFQDSLTALNPAIAVGTQLAEVPRYNSSTGWAEARRQAVDALAGVDIPEPEQRARMYPHQFSGGMRQRSLIAMANLSYPRLLIADEPTTALDVSVQRKVLDLLQEEIRDLQAGALVISHDIAVLAEICTRILVMYRGEIVEDLAVEQLAAPERLAHPYTRALVSSFPTLETDRDKPLMTIPPEFDVEQAVRRAG
ncbi:dipeptide/oligopeptide/nickel ABC transporter permease/ATP-binding protein, partial [Leucobacter sp. wl10]|uniref:dipeptide/oligopeptide/nickel ABC transporter permease/ATP-binding protein n=1 Tax=Leucobacter sp. wl10 TaxID=2304677 RepID=UPI0019698304